MRFSYFILILLLISSCAQEVKDRLQGHWVCVENCDDIKTLDFYKDSVEINRYLKFLRLKDKSLYKTTVNNSTFIFENPSEKINVDFELENDFLILKINGDITFKKMKSDEKSEIKKFTDFGKIEFHFPSIFENPKEKKNFCRNNPVTLIFTKYKNHLVLYYDGNYVPLKNVKNAIIPTHFSYEEYLSNQYFIFIDEKLKMKEVAQIFEIITQAELFKLSLAYKSKNSLNSFPEYFSESIFPQPFDFDEIIFKKRNQLKNHVFKDSVINNYFNHIDEKTEITVRLNQNKIFINGLHCKNLNQFKKELRLLLKHEENVSNSIKIDSNFIVKMEQFLNEKHPINLEFEIENLKKDLEVKKTILKYTKEFQTTNQQSLIILESNSEIDYNQWLQAYVIIREINSELRATVCEKYFFTDYYKLDDRDSEDIEIIKMVRAIYPMRLISFKLAN